jgi:hypothetical protein
MCVVWSILDIKWSVLNWKEQIKPYFTYYVAISIVTAENHRNIKQIKLSATLSKCGTSQNLSISFLQLF